MYLASCYAPCRFLITENSLSAQHNFAGCRQVCMPTKKPPPKGRGHPKVTSLRVPERHTHLSFHWETKGRREKSLGKFKRTLEGDLIELLKLIVVPKKTQFKSATPNWAPSRSEGTSASRIQKGQQPGPKMVLVSKSQLNILIAERFFSWGTWLFWCLFWGYHWLLFLNKLLGWAYTIRPGGRVIFHLTWQPHLISAVENIG